MSTESELLPADTAERVVTLCRTAVGDSLRSVTYFTRDDYDQLYLRSDLAKDAEADLQAICEQRHMRREDAVFLLIATLRPKAEGGLDITVNRRAPVLIDTQRMTGRQVVLNDSRYEVQFQL